MDIKKVMILVKGEDKTREISCVKYDYFSGKTLVTYGNNRTYSYNKSNVTILNNPRIIELKGSMPYINNIPIYKPELILDFGSKIKIIQYGGKAVTVSRYSFSIVKSAAQSKRSQQTMAYLKEISQYTSDTQDKEAYLKQEMEQLTFVHPDSVLSHYINQQSIRKQNCDFQGTIYPFQFNLSQKTAIENAFANSISVIEGPPGTGKTQTILNILANIVAVQGKSVAVVSNNNEAVKNVIEKMEKQGYGFLTALLGRSSNQDAFFANLPSATTEGWGCKEQKFELTHEIKKLNIKLNGLLRVDRRRAQLYQQLRAWSLEQKHFDEYYAHQNVEEISRLPLFNATPDRIASFLVETSLAKEWDYTNKLVYKLRLLFKYGLLDYKKLEQQELSVLLSLQREFYRQQIKRLENEISSLGRKLDNASYNTLLEKHQELSERYFRKSLYGSHNQMPRHSFTRKNYKALFQEFIKTYPIILSTTHALRRSIPENYLLDYIIIDEASQVDLVTGVLAFSCCRNAIIVGDTKQLPQITDEKIQAMLTTMPPDDVYNYFQHNILSSVLDLYGNSLPRQILREHYRCHPQIIEFCNQKYYEGKLIPYTDPNLSECPIALYKTVPGNHMRRVTQGEKKEVYNQRELDVTIDEVLKNPAVYENGGSIGFVTPYRKQANKAKQLLPDRVQSDTVHKYQGREKNVIIMSTVLDETRDGKMGLEFVDDPRMVNVAVSRAINQFLLVTDHNLFFKKSKNIGDLIRYIQYSTLDENIIESQIVSVFDLLYHKYSSKLVSLKSKMNPNARYQSEEALRVLLEEILAEPQNNSFSYVQGMLLRNLLSTVELLTPEELSYVNNRASLDFVVYYKQDKVCSLVIEVDGFAYHENNPDQLRRDALKDSILKKYEIKVLRLATNGSAEKERIQGILSE